MVSDATHYLYSRQPSLVQSRGGFFMHPTKRVRSHFFMGHLSRKRRRAIRVPSDNWPDLQGNTSIRWFSSARAKPGKDYLNFPFFLKLHISKQLDHTQPFAPSLCQHLTLCNSKPSVRRDTQSDKRRLQESPFRLCLSMIGSMAGIHHFLGRYSIIIFYGFVFEFNIVILEQGAL